MTDRSRVEQLVKELHAARLEGDLERLCAVFAPDARLRIAGSSDGKPMAETDVHHGMRSCDVVGLPGSGVGNRSVADGTLWLAGPTHTRVPARPAMTQGSVADRPAPAATRGPLLATPNRIDLERLRSNHRVRWQPILIVHRQKKTPHGHANLAHHCRRPHG